MIVTASSHSAERDRLDTVAALAARCLRIPVSSVALDVPLARLGLDSLGCMELAAQIEHTLGRAVPPAAIVERATVRSLSDALDRAASERGDVTSCMHADAALPEDVVPRRVRSRRSANLRDAHTILLTGATGFLGTALLRALVDHSSARIVCLVRSTRQDAAARLTALTDELAIDGRRIEVVEADLTLPRLGLTVADWVALRGRIDAVCHAGASINWVSPYEALRAVNVFGTRDLLRLASEAGASFHFISSLSVCYSTVAPRQVDETFEPLGTVEGLHFGYAQSKAVAETLVRQARERGLRARIYRPAIISGDSRSGRFNPDDLLSALIAGCVRMGTAPDLDWELDALPVDCVADAIVRLSGGHAAAVHLSHPRPRHWRECALWMRLYGYDIRLVPYAEWSEQLRHDAAIDVDHPLRILRSFFLDRTHEGLSVPELHERGRRPRAQAGSTLRALARAGGHIATLDATLMDRYFAAFVRAGRIPAPVRLEPAVRLKPDTTARLARELLAEAGIKARSVTAVACGAEHSIISELTAWRSKSCTGVFRVDADGRDLILKIKPNARDAVAVGESLAGLCGERLGSAYARWGSRLGLDMGHAREIAIYQDANPAFRAHLPAMIASRSDARTETWAVLLERIKGTPLLDSVDHPDRWRAGHVDAAIGGLAALHARWCGRLDHVRRQPWMGSIRTTADMIEMEPLWSALAEHAAPLFASSAGPSLPALHRRLVEGIPTWRQAADAIPQTLIHNDFNPRNICVRHQRGAWRLCAFDWELATVGAPTRDLAELLCFVCGGRNASAGRIRRWIERHRTALQSASTEPIGGDAWQAAFVSALCELLVDRLAVYALVHRVKPQPFLPRVLRTWLMLFRMCDGDAFAA